MLLLITNSSAFGAEQTPRDLGFVNKFIVNNEGQNFQIVFVANFVVSSPTFNSSNNMLQFNIETSLETENIGGITIPRDLINGEFVVLIDGEEIPYKLSDTAETSVVSIIVNGKGKHTLDITTTDHLEISSNVPNDGGCLIATATFGSELSPQVQLLREIRDNTVFQTESGTTFMTAFNQFYYSFSPAIADYERENIVFKEAVKITITPMLTSLAILNYVDIDSEEEMLGYGIGIILLNIVMYLIAPVSIIMKIRKRVNIEKFDENYA